MRYILLLYTFVALALAQTTPSITAITNAALPALDQHVPVRLQPRSMATIWGKNLSPATASTAPPWVTSLGGIELHLVPFRVGCGTNSPPPNCDIVASLIFVSPTQINFLVPDVSPSAYGQQELQLDAVIVVNGQRFDSGVLLYLSPVGDFAVFQVGYDCDFSLSLVQPQSCGYSQTPGQNTLPLGAVTDLAGNQVTSQNPIHQGQVVTLWATGLNSLSTDPRTGLLQQNMPSPITFGVTTSNAGGSTFFTFNWRTQTPLWAGESPQYVGLSQLNVAFPTCNGALATAEERYNVAMPFATHDYSGHPTNALATLYMPFIIRPGEATCQFGAPTSTTVVSSANPASGIQEIDFTVTVSPSGASGTVALSDGQSTLAVATLVGGKAIISVSTSPSSGLATGNYSIQATYNGSATYLGSLGTVNQSIQNPPLTATTTTLVASANPSVVGQPMTFTATVSPCCLPTGSVIFSFGNEGLGCSDTLTLSQGKVTCVTFGTTPLTGSQITGLSTGTYLVTATYSGDNTYASSSSNPVTQVIQMTPGQLSLSVWADRGGTGASEAALGEEVLVSASVGYPGQSSGQYVLPAGTVTFYDGTTVLGTDQVTEGQAGLTIYNLSLGTHVFKASYSGDVNVGSATSGGLTITIWTISSFTSTPNPSTVGQTVAFTLCGIPSNVTHGFVIDGFVRFIIDGTSDNVRIASPCTSDQVNSLVRGTHLIHVGLAGTTGVTAPTVTFPVSITQTVN